MGMIVYLRRVPREQLAGLSTSPEELSDLLYGEDGEVLDLDKAWHGLHYLLTGTDFDGEEPLGFLLMGGEAVGDRGMGPIRAFTPAQLVDISRALEKLDGAELRRRFDPEEMTALNIYPDIWMRDLEEDTLGYVLDAFERLKPFLREGVQRGLGLLVYMS